ncbi:putative transcription factor interactor and regulator CCHC(Zn) family [Helianthus annuus]|nr:putative transcription factor interactor and regulator CCHC(Zn) family [Helianthus annuus]
MLFLMGLDSTYQSVRATLLTKESLPSVKDAFSIISREESHLNTKHFSEKVLNNTIGFNVVTYESKKTSVRTPNPNLKCSHCNKIGHTIERCFELVGYPSWTRSKNSGNKGSRVSNNVAIDNYENNTSSVTPRNYQSWRDWTGIFIAQRKQIS